MAGNDDAVGYGRPPQHTRWKKGQSGNLKGRRRGKRPPKLREIVDDILITEVAISENGVARQVTVFEVILLQLLKKIADGNLRAKRLLDRCKALTNSRPEIYVITADEQKQMADEYERRLRR